MWLASIANVVIGSMKFNLINSEHNDQRNWTSKNHMTQQQQRQLRPFHVSGWRVTERKREKETQKQTNQRECERDYSILFQIPKTDIFRSQFTLIGVEHNRTKTAFIHSFMSSFCIDDEFRVMHACLVLFLFSFWIVLFFLFFIRFVHFSWTFFYLFGDFHIKHRTQRTEKKTTNTKQRQKPVCCLHTSKANQNSNTKVRFEWKSSSRLINVHRQMTMTTQR